MWSTFSFKLLTFASHSSDVAKGSDGFLSLHLGGRPLRLRVSPHETQVLNDVPVATGGRPQQGSPVRHSPSRRGRRGSTFEHVGGVGGAATPAGEP